MAKTSTLLSCVGLPGYQSCRCNAFVADITQDDLSAHVKLGSIDFCTMIFVLSAISPEMMPQAIRNVKAVLKPGTGRILFRDYAEGDLAQERLHNNGVKLLSERFYVRGDGTRCADCACASGVGAAGSQQVS